MNESNFLPKRMIYRSLVFQFIIALPLISFFVLLLLNIHTEPLRHYAQNCEYLFENEDEYGEVCRGFAARLTVIHMWFALFSASATFSCMGSLVSYSSRDIDFNKDFDNESFILSLHIIGSIFGVLLLLMFIGGFIAGNLFPNFSGAGAFRIYHSFSNIEDWAKLFVWAFIAGFSERLMPSILNNFAKKIEDASKD